MKKGTPPDVIDWTQSFAPGSDVWEQSRVLFDASLDHRPSRVFRPPAVAEAVAIVRQLQRGRIPHTIKSGGHSAAGLSVRDDVVLVDVSLLRAVTVDRRLRLATLEPGALMADLDGATVPNGLATTGGTVSHTGVVGLAAGGGLGWLMGRFGLACDNIVSADIVADGELVRLDESSAEMRAFRGSGTSLGFVKGLTMQVHPIEPRFRWTALTIPADGAADAFGDFTAHTNDLPAAAGCSFSLSGSTTGRLEAIIDIIAPCSCEHSGQWIAHLATTLNGQVTVDEAGYDGIQQMLDAQFPFGMRSYRRSFCSDVIDRSYIEALARHLSSPSDFHQSVTVDVLHHRALDGHLLQASSLDRWKFVALLVCRWSDPALDEAGRAAGRGMHEAIRRAHPNAMPGHYGNYSSEPDDADPGEGRPRDARGARR